MKFFLEIIHLHLFTHVLFWKKKWWWFSINLFVPNKKKLFIDFVFSCDDADDLSHTESKCIQIQSRALIDQYNKKKMTRQIVAK